MGGSVQSGSSSTLELVRNADSQAAVSPLDQTGVKAWWAGATHLSSQEPSGI